MVSERQANSSDSPKTCLDEVADIFHDIRRPGTTASAKHQTSERAQPDQLAGTVRLVRVEELSEIRLSGCAGGKLIGLGRLGTQPSPGVTKLDIRSSVIAVSHSVWTTTRLAMVCDDRRINCKERHVSCDRSAKEGAGYRCNSVDLPEHAGWAQTWRKCI